MTTTASIRHLRVQRHRWASFFIAKSNPHPARPLLREFCKSPDGLLAFFGVQGVKWEFNSAGLPVNTASYNKATDDEKLMLSGTWYFQGSDYTEGLSWIATAFADEDPDIKYHKYSIYDTKQRLARLAQVKPIMAANRNPTLAKAIVPSDNDIYAQQTKINDQWTKVQTQMITATSEAEVGRCERLQQFAKATH